jgi:alpha-amylase
MEFMMHVTAYSSGHARKLLLALFAGSAMGFSSVASAQEDPAPTLQWFETRWTDMERRMPDYFMAGYGAVWLPPVSKGYIDPRSANQNGNSAGYDPFDRFDLGSPGRQTAYGTEAGFDQVVDEFHRAGAQVFIDMVLNHNAGRQTSLQFQQDGGYPGFWMGPLSGGGGKGPTDNWGDFHNGVASGYYQSENPGSARYCLLQGDLVALVDINQASNNLYIRQPVAAGNVLNVPQGTFFNRPNANNRRFYFDTALGTTSVSNPGMFVTNAGVLSTGIFAPPCTVPARNEPATNLTLGRFNVVDGSAGDPVAENATSYMMRWVQWMMDVHGVDGFRIDAVKHTPSWFFDTYFDATVAGRRRTPDGRFVTPYSFGESVEGNDFTFDRYIRMPNGRGSNGRNVAQDAFGNRDALDLGGAGRLRDIVNGFNDWGSPFGNNFFTAHLDNVDDGLQNGTIGVNHIFSHDNGSNGNGSSSPGIPTARQQGWFAHAYLAMRPGQKKFYHNGRGVARPGGFYPREGLPVALGVDPTATVTEAGTGRTLSAPNTAISSLISLANMLGRGEFLQRWQDSDVLVFERRTRTGPGTNDYSSNMIGGATDNWSTAAAFDERTVASNFPAGTRLIELTGNAANPLADPGNQVPEVIIVQANGNVTIRIPRNARPGPLVEHGLGFVIYAPAIPSGTMSIVGSTTQIPQDDISVPSTRRRANALPIVTGNTFTLRLETTNGDAGATNNDNADDNALFRINAGYQDWNGNGQADFDFTTGIAAGYENFVTTRQPLFGTTNTSGLYEQTINSANLPEGVNYVSAYAFRKRNANDAALFREFRRAIYVDRLAPTVSLVTSGPFPLGTTQSLFQFRADDRTVTRVNVVLNPTDLSNPPSLASILNQATQQDRYDYTRTLTGLVQGNNTVLVIVTEESGRVAWQTFTVVVGAVCDSIDFNRDGLFPDSTDLDDFLAVLSGGPGACSTFPTPGCGDLDFNNDGLFPDSEDLDAFIRRLGGGSCD